MIFRGWEPGQVFGSILTYFWLVNQVNFKCSKHNAIQLELVPETFCLPHGFRGTFFYKGPGSMKVLGITNTVVRIPRELQNHSLGTPLRNFEMVL